MSLPENVIPYSIRVAVEKGDYYVRLSENKGQRKI